MYYNDIQPTKLTTVKYNMTIAAKYSQKALSSEICIYLVSGFIYFLKQTIMINNKLLVITNEPKGANTPDINEFLGKSPTNIK